MYIEHHRNKNKTFRKNLTLFYSKLVHSIFILCSFLIYLGATKTKRNLPAINCIHQTSQKYIYKNS